MSLRTLRPRRLTGLLLLAFAPDAAADSPAIILDSIAGGLSGTTQDQVMGWEFTADANDTITSVGIYDKDGDGLGASHAVGIWDSSETLLRTATVPSGTGAPLSDDFRYVAITPLAISSGQTYYIGALFPTPLSDEVIQGNSANTISTHPSITWLHERRELSSTLVFPSDPGSSPYPGFFGPSFLLDSDPGTIVVEKQTDPDGAPGSFTFTGDAAGTIADDDQITVGGLAPGTYTATESNPSPAFSLSDISCDDGNSSGDVGTRTATFQLEAGETVTCTFTNTTSTLATLTLRVSAFPAYELMTAGVAPPPTLVDNGGGGHTVSDQTTLWSTMGPVVVNPLTGLSLQASFLNLGGAFSSGFSTPNPVGPGILCPGGCLGGFQPLTGLLRVGTPATKGSLPMFVVGTGMSTTDMLPLVGGTMTLTGAPFLTGSAVITGIRSTFVTIPARGGAFGLPLTLEPTAGEALVKQFTPMGLTSTTTMVTVQGTNNLISAVQGGQVSLVTPMRIKSNLGFDAAGVVVEKFVFMPEPTTPLLLAAGIATLVALGRRRMRR